MALTDHSGVDWYLEREGAFRRFLDIVRERPDTEQQWLAPEAAWLDEQVADWLVDNGLASRASELNAGT